MKMFEYRAITVRGVRMELVEKLNELGKEGWELVSLETDRSDNYPYNYLILKREISSKSSW